MSQEHVQLVSSYSGLIELADVKFENSKPNGAKVSSKSGSIQGGKFVAVVPQLEII